MPAITVTGAREHNLREVDVAIPAGSLTVVTGVSGSGKSSLVFDTIAAESQRQLNQTHTAFVRNRLPGFGRPDVDAVENLPASVVVDQKPLGGNSRSTVGTITEIGSLMRLLWSRAGTPHIGESTAFSFNDPAGMCPRCQGLGTVKSIDLDQLVDRDRSLNEGAIRFPTFGVGGWTWRTFTGSKLFDNDVPLREFTDEQWRVFLYGADALVERPTDAAPVPKQYEGLLPRFERIWLPKDVESLKGNTREAYRRVVTQGTCPDCGGTRLSERARSVTVDGWTITDCAALEAERFAEVLRGLDTRAAEPVAAALAAQLDRLAGIGLGYLSMDRATTTLSGGESQRVKTVRHLGNTLTGLLYVFDEPSAGLHAQDVAQLTSMLLSLRDKGNTVLVVEHDQDVVAAADHVVDLGPGAGRDGGTVTYTGPPPARPRTGAIKRAPRTPRGVIEIRGAGRHNLRDIDVDVPTGVLTAVTGVAGSGKSTLVHGYLPDAVVIDQRAVRGSRRSSPITYTGVLDTLRAKFAAENGVGPGLFSPNAEGGCPECGGLGVIYTDLAFLDPMVSTCERCEGRRFTEEALRHTYRGVDIGTVFRMSAAEALEHFGDPRLARMVEVGLGYLPLGQPLTTLSGGERQRLKLAAELDKPGGVYVFDEPTTGLHPRDVDELVRLFDRLVDGGATVVVIEHDLDVVRRADHVIDLGPGPGRHGGRVLFTGPPAALAEADTPTGRHLRARSEASRQHVLAGA
ncbi:excinuclease ABC subunit UvrA [Amycolatopsis suaedae]|uniref:UvrABC system protein A n=1 Tax=Amycolatopsis suaedae TaxID=2510978 RepID=A0A4V2EKY2_9PSEU|nr:excinuclease ABC subunit UvrA [Amycolatopsis suaedae]RZQ59655.1 excinuclease ABC subunit UvrA [Amycolatopsis suaedae]